METADPIKLSAYQRRAPESQSQVPAPTPGQTSGQSPYGVTAFTRQELSAILAIYGRLQTEGEARDYALDFGRDTAVFSIFRRTSEVPLYRIEKTPKLARKQGAFSVITATGLILKRGHELPRVLEVLANKVRVVGR
jgi:Protein of unknown function (DUF2794)